MDIFGEQLVKKRASTSDWLKKIFLTLGALVLAMALMTVSLSTGFMVLTFIAVGVLFGAVWLLGGMSYEYEYIVTNDDLDIDKISGKRKRKRLITIKLNTAESFGVYDGSQGEGVAATVMATDGTGVNAYYLIAKHRTHGQTMVIFSPDERMVQLILSALPHKVKASARLHFKPETQSEE